MSSDDSDDTEKVIRDGTYSEAAEFIGLAFDDYEPILRPVGENKHHPLMMIGFCPYSEDPDINLASNEFLMFITSSSQAHYDRGLTVHAKCVMTVEGARRLVERLQRVIGQVESGTYRGDDIPF
jgi:hypothetical protein